MAGFPCLPPHPGFVEGAHPFPQGSSAFHRNEITGNVWVSRFQMFGFSLLVSGNYCLEESGDFSLTLSNSYLQLIKINV